MTKQVEAFKLTVPDTDIADLRKRLRRTRFPDQAPGPGWAYGTDVAWMRGLIDYWGEKFDWRAQEDRLNAFPQYKVRLHDIDLHFLHVEGQGPERDWLFILAILRAHAQVVASSCECQDSHLDRLLRISLRDTAAAAVVGNPDIYGHSSLDRHVSWRPFRCNGTAGSFGRRNT